MDSSSRRSTTAEGAAFCRALGALERDRSLRNPDHLAHRFVTRRGWKLGLLPVLRGLARRSVERSLPGALLLHQVRTRLFDALTLAAVREGAEQIVVLGAGADSRAYRFPRELAGTQVFEVDHPETSDWKRARVRRSLGAVPANVRYVPVDLGADPAAPALAGAGYDDGRRSFFLWEGVSMYLRPDSVDAVLSLLAAAPQGSAIAFDYLYADAVAHPSRFEGGALQAQFAASQGEPFVFGLDPALAPMTTFLRARSLELAQSWSHDELRAIHPGPGFLMPYVGVVHAARGAGATSRRP
jgi:methyltransferase (TIGR00027 family)